ncbi:MAG TPA: TIGR01212 family radical SAM protein [Bacteroidales bacterium]|nr:TIGR01212 family radical SAM protein [Bacteroidales bacterium]HPW78085.1 TIGR01212 family radical SAM protein [Bacteroidales bacterium]HQB56575.1 TIGR01212 family radical SAM protein [Bacteroidales bacterium]
MQRYRSFTGYFIHKYGTRLQKVVVDAGFTCPNRDGTAGTGGCTYCDNRAFHPSYSTPEKSLIQQIDEGIEFHKVRYRRAGGYLAYFQPYSNTYAPLEELRRIYRPVLEDPRIKGIVIGTRPDCIDMEKLRYFKDLSQEMIVMIEYGVESCYNRTLERINRGHTWEQSVEAIEATAALGIHTGVHMIFGLPGESRDEMLAEAGMLSRLPITSLKMHQLQIVRDTAMEKEFAEKPGDFVTFSLNQYLDFVVDFLERLRPDMFIERIVGEVPPRFVRSTPWGLIRNVEILRLLEKRLEERDTFQGAEYVNPKENAIPCNH